MEVEQVLPIPSSKLEHITNGDNSIVIPSSIITMEEKDHLTGVAAETNDADTITTVMDKHDGDDNTMTTTEEPAAAIAITRSASSNERRHQQSKKRGAFGLFRAMFMSFSGSASMKKRDAAAAAAAMVGDRKKSQFAASGEKTAAVARSASDVASWKNLVDGMRPLRLYGQLEYYPPPSPERGIEGMMMTSRYSSAQDLQVLVNGHEKEEEEEQESAPATEDGGCSPNAIDMQAEEFIAKFYEQFRLQKSDSFNNRTD
uniref:Uncharacterized protein n=1 Tax=Leersia perrieri TaxID=77586 RepID=A0A0D9V0I5_9ORYZ